MVVPLSFLIFFFGFPKESLLETLEIKNDKNLMRLKDYFIASETNDYQPWILKPIALVVFTLVIWSLRIFIPTSFTFAAPGIDAVDLMDRVNAERTNRFISSLITNSNLITAATAKSNDMIARNYFAHVDPDGNYVWGRIESAGYTPYLILGENLAMDFTSATTVVEAWMSSPTHRANIVNEKFQDQGMASIYGELETGRNSILITNLFGTLLKKPAPPSSTEEEFTKKITRQPPPSSPAKTPAPAPAPIIEIKINPDIKIVKKIIGDNQVLEIDVIVAGAPASVIASIKDKTIALLPSAITGQYLGVLTFPKGTDLSTDKLQIKAGEVSADFSLANLPGGENESPGNPVGVGAAVGSESQFIRVLKIIFGVLAGLYAVFLLIDSVIIHRAKIKRTNLPSSPHSLLFLLIVAVNFLTAF